MEDASRLERIARLCEDAALPSPERHTHADALLEAVGATKELQQMLDGGIAPGATAIARRRGLSAALAIDALSDRRAVSTAERQRVDQLVDVVAEADDVDAEHKALALAARARVRLLVGQAELALADLEHARRLLEPSIETKASTHAFVAARYGYALAMAARLEESLAAHERSAALARESGDVRALVSALQDEGNLLQQLGHIDKARERFELSREQAIAAGDEAGEMRAYAGVAFVHLEAFELEASREAYAKAIAIGERGVAPRLHAIVLGYSAVLHLEHERLERAIALAARAVANSSRLGFRLGEGFFASVQAAAHARRGDLESADDRLRFARGRVPSEHSYVDVVRLYEAHVDVERAEQHARSGRPAAAGHALDQARAVLEELSHPRPNETRAFALRLDDARIAARMLRARLAVVTEAHELSKEASQEARETESLAMRLDARRMMSYLRVHPGKTVSAVDLASYVWPPRLGDVQETDETARARLDALLAMLAHASTSTDQGRTEDEVRRVVVNEAGYTLTK